MSAYLKYREDQAHRAMTNLGWWFDDEGHAIDGRWRVNSSQAVNGQHCVFDVKDLDAAEAELRWDERQLWDEMVSNNDQCLECARHWFGYKDITGNPDEAAAAKHHAHHRLELAAEEMSRAWTEYRQVLDVAGVGNRGTLA